MEVKGKNRKGMSIVEALLAVSLFSLMAMAFVGAWLYGQEAAAVAGTTNQAQILAEEGLEAVRGIRDESFANLVDGTYGLAAAGGRWSFAGSSDATGAFTRQVTISPVDAVTKKVTVLVTWQKSLQRTGQVSLETLLSSWREASGPVCNWSSVSVKDSFNSGANTGDAAKVAASGDLAYLIYPSGTPNFVIIDAANVPAVQRGTLASSVSLPTLTNVFVSGNYAYVTSTDNTAELQIIDVSNPASLSKVGTFDAPGTEDGLAVWVADDTAFLARAGGSDAELLTVNVSAKSGPTLRGSIDLGGNGDDQTGIYVFGNYAYLSSKTNGRELKVVDISSLSSPAYDAAWGYDAAGNNDGLAVTGFGTLVILGTASGPTYILDLANPVASLRSTYLSDNDVNSLTADEGNKAFFDGTNQNVNMEFEAVSVSDPANPSVLGQLNWSRPVFGTAFAGDRCRAYLATGSSASLPELLILEPGTDVTPPNAVTDLAASNPTADSVRLAWTAPSDTGGFVLAYDIRYSTSPINNTNWDTATQANGEPGPAAPGSAETFTVSGLSADTTYYFALKSMDNASPTANISVLSNVPSQKTLDNIPPATVSNLSASNPTPSSILLTWTAPGDDGNTGTAASYDIRYSTAPITDANWGAATQVTGEPAPQIIGTAQTMTISGLSPLTTYYFALKTADEVPNVSALSNVASLATLPGPDTTAPAAITNLALSVPSGRAILLTWTAPGDDGNTGTAASYDIRYSTAPITDANWGAATQVTGEPVPQIAGTAQTMRVGGLSWNTIYYFAIRTADEVPNISALSNVPNLSTRSQASYLNINVATARSNAPADNTQVINATIQNSDLYSGESITINSMNITWASNANQRVNTVRISGTNYWTGTATKGTLLNFSTPFAMVEGTTYPITYVDYLRSMVGNSANVWAFNLADGTSVSSNSFNVTQ